MTLADAGLIVEGVGSLASAWGSYKTSKERNKLLNKQLEYEKAKDDKILAIRDANQENVDDAWADFSIEPKKKKKKDPSTDSTEVAV